MPVAGVATRATARYTPSSAADRPPDALPSERSALSLLFDPRFVIEKSGKGLCPSHSLVPVAGVATRATARYTPSSAADRPPDALPSERSALSLLFDPRFVIEKSGKG